MPDVVMPRLSDSMEEGTVLKWLKAVGDEVAVGDELVEIETDKANMVYEAPDAGTLSEIVAGEGDTLPIGEVIGRIGDGGGAPSTPPQDSSDGDTASPESDDPAREASSEAGQAQAGSGGANGASASEGGGVAVPSGTGERVKASPLARRIAEENGVDLTQLSGSGPGGRIIKADVENAPASAAAPDARVPAGPPAVHAAGSVPGPSAGAGSPETAKGAVSYEDLTKLQSTVARRMAESKATAPHFHLAADVDMSRAVEARTRLKASSADGDVVPSYNDMVVKACALALREFPRANGAYRDGRFELYSRVNVGVAVAAQNALVVPTIFDADLKGLRQIANEMRAVAQRVRDGSVTPPELSGGTFTVSNLGMFGIDSFQAVINSPQAGILAVGAITEEPVVRDDEVTTAHLMSVDLACDHRILYGADGAEFLARIRTLLEEPLALAL